jgi:hypothetical protein
MWGAELRYDFGNVAPPLTTKETDLVSATCSRDSNGDLWQTGEKMQD